MKVVETQEFGARYAELLAEVKAGETVRIAEGGTVVVEVKAVDANADRKAIFREILQNRTGRPVVTQAEWAEWIHEGHRC